MNDKFGSVHHDQSILSQALTVCKILLADRCLDSFEEHPTSLCRAMDDDTECSMSELADWGELLQKHQGKQEECL